MGTTVIHLDDFQPPLTAPDRETVTSLSLSGTSEGDVQGNLILDQMRLGDDRWFSRS